MAFLSTSIDDVNAIDTGSHQRIRLREILFALPQKNCGIRRKL